MMRFAFGTVVCLMLAACGDPSAATKPTSTAQVGTAGSGLNAIRAEANLPPVRRNAVLDGVAKGHAQDMLRKGFFGHKGSNGSTVGKRVERAGYRWCSVAENIAKGFPTREATIEQWRKSPSHYKNLTKRRVKEYGIAQVGDIWVMVLAAKRC
ncbi:MAG: CAP domain-containing protein [Sulfitobacter sp.]